MKAALTAAALAVALMPGPATEARRGPGSGSETTTTITIRGKSQTLHTFGSRGKQAVLVSSGDGGWTHLAPLIAKMLADRGFFVVGFDAKAYLSSFTTADATLTEADVPGDYGTVIDFAAAGSTGAPILVGVSEGAGLSVLAATRQDVKQKVGGVIAVGLPDKTELGWRWRDSIIYLTHAVPNEPTFSTASVVERVTPVPLVAIHSTSDEFVPLDTVKGIMARAKEPKQLWTITASDHRFSGKEGEFEARLLEALAWVTRQKPGGD